MSATNLSLVPNRLLGIDVSNNNDQDNIDWDAIADSGVVWAYIKAGEDRKIEGTPQYGYYTDPYFGRNFTECLRVGIIPGAYYFVRPSGSEPAVSVTKFEEQIRTVVGDSGLPSRTFAVVDFEEETNDNDQLVWLSECDNAIRDSQFLCKGNGRAVWNYSSTEFLHRHGCLVGGSTPTAYPYIQAAYQKKRPVASPGYRQVAWQFSAHGQIPGIQSDVDLDVFFGTMDDLLALTMP